MPERLRVHHKLLISDSDKFVDYIQHVENQKKAAFKANLSEIQMLNASGTALKSTRYADLKFIVEEQEAETESRDLNS